MTGDPRLSLAGTATFPSGQRSKFALSISAPFPHDEFGWQCDIVCDLFRDKPMRVHGHEKEFAWCQALGFVQLMVDDMNLTLQSDSGEPLALPRPDYDAWGVNFPPSQHY